MRLLTWLQFVVAALELPPNPRERHFWGRLAVLQLIYSLAGLLLGLACLIGGGWLFLPRGLRRPPGRWGGSPGVQQGRLRRAREGALALRGRGRPRLPRP